MSKSNLFNALPTEAMKIADYCIQSNTELASGAGLKNTIKRVEVGNCCPWCKALAGTYSYPDGMPEDFFRRHDNCRCLITSSTSKAKRSTRAKKLVGETERNIIRAKAMTGATVTPQAVSRQYENIASMTTDIEAISLTSGFTKSEIVEIKRHLFIDAGFAPDAKVAASWQRLLDGKQLPGDIMLLKHVREERKLLSKGLSLEQAHAEATAKFDYIGAL